MGEDFGWKISRKFPFDPVCILSVSREVKQTLNRFYLHSNINMIGALECSRDNEELCRSWWVCIQKDTHGTG
jgi:hypothetical protein